MKSFCFCLEMNYLSLGQSFEYKFCVLWINKRSEIFPYVLFCFESRVHTCCSACVEVREQLSGLGSHLPLCGIWRLTPQFDGKHLYIVSHFASLSDVFKHAVACMSCSPYLTMYAWKSYLADSLR